MTTVKYEFQVGDYVEWPYPERELQPYRPCCYQSSVASSNYQTCPSMIGATSLGRATKTGRNMR